MSKITSKSIIPFVVLVGLALAAAFIKPEADYVPSATETPYSASDIAWVLISSALVFLMTPGLRTCSGRTVESCRAHRDSIRERRFTGWIITVRHTRF